MMHLRGSTGSGEEMVTSPSSFHPLLSILYSPHQGVAPRDMEWSGLLARTLLFTSDMLPFVYLFLKLGIQGFNKQDIGSHQSYSRKTLIALVTSGVLLAILGTTGYFLMNRRSWSPTGERLVSSGVWGKANEEDNKLSGEARGYHEREGENTIKDISGIFDIGIYMREDIVSTEE